jgi:alpha-D-xyloside xylohydrolase
VSQSSLIKSEMLSREVSAGRHRTATANQTPLRNFQHQLRKFRYMTWKKDASTGFSRRSLAKGIACSALFAAVREVASQVSYPASSKDAPSQPTIDKSWTEIMPGVWRVRIGSPEAFTPTTSRYFPPAKDAMEELPTISEAPLPEPSAFIDRRGTTVLLPLGPRENIYGLGLQMLSFNQRGKKKTLRVNADPQMDTGDSHAPVPFYVSTRGYGIFVDTARYATFCFGTAQRAQDHTVDQRHGYGVDEPVLEDSEKAFVTVQVDEAQGVDVYLFGGPTMLDVVRRYNLFSGGGVNPPEWGLGVWYRVQAKSNSEGLLRFAREFRQRKIPCDVLGIEPGWQTHAYPCSFQWSSSFPNPPQMIQKLNAMNYKVNLWEHAYVHPSAPFHEAMKPFSGDYLVWQGLVPDFQKEEARRIFGEYHRRTFIDIGISGFKLDECDNSDFTGGWAFPEFSHFPSGQDGEQMHSVFGLRYQQAIQEQYEDAKMPTYGLVRSSGALAAPSPFVLYSDLYNHRAFVRSLVNSGFSGLLWCPEVRDAKNPEDLIRRLQTAVFSPLAMINGWYIANPPWKQQNKNKNNANEFEPGWEELEARCREILNWRMQLLPYLRAAFARYALDATPPFRALVLEDPTDSALIDCDDEFMVGDRMMVAPLFAGESTRRVILPRGVWHDFWTGEAVAGGQAIEVSASYARIPVFVKSGSVFPMGGVANCTADPKTRDLTVRIFGDGSLPFTIDRGKQTELRLSWKNGKGNIEQQVADRAYIAASWVPATKGF